MNVVVANGYYANGSITEMPDGSKCFKFNIMTNVPNRKGAILVECRAFDRMCDYCYAELSEGCYIEVTGQLSRFSRHHNMYVFVQNLVVQKPKARRQAQIRTTDFLQTYQPAKVMQRLNDYGEKKRKEEEKKNG